VNLKLLIEVLHFGYGREQTYASVVGLNTNGFITYLLDLNKEII
jgi:hypothetical protein